MDLTSIFISKDKEISSIELDKPDRIYQIWELGKILSEILEVSDINSPCLKDLLCTLIILSKKMDIGIMEDFTRGFEQTLREIEEDKLSDLKELCKRTNYWQNMIVIELRAQSIHIYHLFCFCTQLMELRRLIISSNFLSAYQKIDETTEMLRKLEKGDKKLESANLELTKENLQIISHRLRIIKKNLSKIQMRQKMPQIRIQTFIEKFEKEYNLWMELILDIKNPQDYLTGWRKVVNFVFLIGGIYALLGISMGIIGIVFRGMQEGEIVKTLLIPLIPILIPIFLYVIRKFRQFLIVSSF